MWDLDLKTLEFRSQTSITHSTGVLFCYPSSAPNILSSLWLMEDISLWEGKYNFTQLCKRKGDCIDVKGMEISDHKGCFAFCLWTGNYCIVCLSSYIYQLQSSLSAVITQPPQTDELRGPEPEIVLLRFTNIISANRYSLGNRCAHSSSNLQNRNDKLHLNTVCL